MEFLPPLVEGFLLGASLIVAIGAQNAFVLRQGLKREHVFWTAAFCAGADLILIVAGAYGLGALVSGAGWFLAAMSWGGAAFLAWYGLRAAQRALRSEHWEDQRATPPLSLAAVTGALAAFTFLNPHVYLDTVLLLGGLGARYPVALRPWFVGGAATASVVWFFGLAYGARLLAPAFRRPLTWRLLDGAIALVMLSLAVGLAVSGWTATGWGR